MQDKRHRSLKRWIWIGAAIVAILVIGIAIGTHTEPVTVPPGQHTAR